MLPGYFGSNRSGNPRLFSALAAMNVLGSLVVGVTAGCTRGPTGTVSLHSPSGPGSQISCGTLRSATNDASGVRCVRAERLPCRRSSRGRNVQAREALRHSPAVDYLFRNVDPAADGRTGRTPGADGAKQDRVP